VAYITLHLRAFKRKSLTLNDLERQNGLNWTRIAIACECDETVAQRI